MRGFPPIQIFLLCLMFVVLAVPLSQLTGTVNVTKDAAPVKVVEGTSVKALVRLRYAHRPATLSVKIEEKELIGGIEASPMEVDASLPSAKDGVDVFLKATWPEGNSGYFDHAGGGAGWAGRRGVKRGGLPGEAMDEVITFIWK